MKFTIGQFNDSYEPVMDGVANVTKNYAYWLSRKGCDSYVVTPSCPGYEDINDFKVLRYFSVPLPKRRPYRYGIPQLDYGFNRDVNTIPFDLVHCHCPFTSGKLALKIARKRGIPIITTFHSKYYDDFKEATKSDSIAKLMTQRIISFYNEVDSVWTVNASTAETLRCYGYEGDIEIMHNGADFDTVGNLKEYIKKGADYLKVGEEGRVLLFVGQHIWQKNTKLIIEALRLLRDKGEKFKMFFVGEGVVKKDMEEMVESYRLKDCVEFLGVIHDRSLLKAIFARADLFLFPSMYDTSGIVVREAAAVKTPSLVVKDSNASEGIRDGFNGFIAEENEEAYCRKIIDILSDAVTMEKAGENAQKTVFESWEDISSKVLEKYEEMIEKYEFKQQRRNRRTRRIRI